MANLYSSLGDTSMQMTQAELCSLEEALNNALASGPDVVRSNFHSYFVDFLQNSSENAYDPAFTDKMKAWNLHILFHLSYQTFSK